MECKDVRNDMRVFTHNGDEYIVKECLIDGVLACKVEYLWVDELNEESLAFGDKQFLGYNIIYAEAPVSQAERKLKELNDKIAEAQEKLDNITLKSTVGEDASLVTRLLNAKRITGFHKDSFDFTDLRDGIEVQNNSIQFNATLTIYPNTNKVIHSINFSGAHYDTMDTKDIFIDLTDQQFEAKYTKHINKIWGKKKYGLYDYYRLYKNHFTKYPKCFSNDKTRLIIEGVKEYIRNQLQSDAKGIKNLENQIKTNNELIAQLH